MRRLRRSGGWSGAISILREDGWIDGEAVTEARTGFMSDPRIVFEEDYTAALGRAVYVFAVYEWVIVWTGERLQPGFRSSCGGAKPKTSRQIACAFKKLLENPYPDRTAKDLFDLSELHARFDASAEERNRLVHARPGTGPSGEQMLFYKDKGVSKDWPLPEVEEAHRRFDWEACEANALYYRLWPSQG